MDRMKKMFLAFIFVPALIFCSALSDLAGSMQPKTWAQLSTNGLSTALGGYSGGCSTSPLEYADNASWDPVHKKLFFLGAPHYCWPWKFLIYDDASNQWSTGPLPASGMQAGGSQIGHGYDNNALDPVTGDAFHEPYNSRTIYRYSGGSWSTYTTVPSSNVPSLSITYGLAYFPEMGGLVFTQGNGPCCFFNSTTRQWSTLTQSFSSGSYHIMSAYDPVHHVVLFGGGNGSTSLYAVNASGTVTRKSNAPTGYGVNTTIFKSDPVTGKLILIPYGSGTAYEYEYDSDAWTTFSGNRPPFTPGIGITASISTYGVVMVVNRNATVYLYKHASGTGIKRLPEAVPVSDLQVSPNPARALVHISVPGKGQGKAAIYDLRGRTIGRAVPSGGELSWNAAKFPAGIYIIKVKTEGREYSKRILVQK